jgi:class 3 adenylate cyclase/tetratricopeptide (TPR) repeat protein
MAASTTIGERLDSESVRELSLQYFREMRSVINYHGGFVEKFIGDAVVAAFGIPVAHEDDVLRAVRATQEMRDRLNSLNQDFERLFGTRIAVRIGVNTGEVVTGDSFSQATFVTGDAVNVAARLEQSAAPGEILLGEQTYKLVCDSVTAEPAGPLHLKGKAEPVSAYRLLTVESPLVPTEARTQMRFVGRLAEMQLLETAYRQVISRRAARLFTILGDPGVGKSRLASEFRSRISGEATILYGRCLSYGEGITFWAVAEAVRRAAGIGESDTRHQARAKVRALLDSGKEAELVATRVGQAIGLEGGGAVTEEITWAIRQLFDGLARRRPLVLVFDDIHWADAVFLDFLANFPSFSQDAPILLLCLARTDLLEERPDWDVGLRLQPLDQETSIELVQSLAGGKEVREEVRLRVVATADGNPLFVEQLIAMLVGDGLLERENGARVLRRELNELSLPPTINLLLSARLDRLSKGERDALERGAIEGHVFHVGAVVELSDSRESTELADHVRTLTAKGFIDSEPGRAIGGEAYRFNHVLIRDVTYNGIPKKARADLHERFAFWLERETSDRASEQEEMVGFHLEQSFRYLEQLGPLDERGKKLAEHARERLGRAGRRAFERADMSAAVNLLDRAISLHPVNADLTPGLYELGEALIEVGDFERGQAILIDVATRAAAGGDKRSEARARLELAWFRSMSHPEGGLDEIGRAGERALEVGHSLSDDGLLANALHRLGLVHFASYRCGQAVQTLQRALKHARRAGDLRAESYIVFWLAAAESEGPTPTGDAIARLERILNERGSSLLTEAACRNSLGLLRARRGDFGRARKELARVREIFSDLGMALYRAGISINIGEIELLAGDPEAAERALRVGYDDLKRMGDKAFRCGAAHRLAEACYRQGRFEEARELIQEVRELAASDDIDAQSGWRSIQAKLLARQREVRSAVALGTEAVALMKGTDVLAVRGGALENLAEVFRVLGRPEEAMVPLQEALHLYDQKADLVSAERAQSLLAQLASAGRPRLRP